MTGPEHYQAAEKWLSHATGNYEGGGEDEQAGQLAALIALGHAQLAHAAAAAELDSFNMIEGAATGRRDDRGTAWDAVLQPEGGSS